MNFYSNFIVPLGIEWGMSSPLFTQYRQALLSEVSGNVLEIGVGTGLNIPHYPATVEKLTAIDANLGMKKFAQKRIDKASFMVEYRSLNGESLPLEDNQFDSVVSTWTLCSIAKVNQAISEVYRVLKPGGKFFFIEHGLSNEPKIQVWQNRLTPIQKVMADGCHLNRQIKALVESQFKLLTIKEFYDADLPKFIGYFYQGVAVKIN